jgi:hypothetical protein
MEEDQYLTKDLKDYYMSDFQNLLSFKTSDFWDIDEGLETLLRKININVEFQTLYSKKFKINPDSFPIEGESYLELAFTKKAHGQLLQILNQVKNSTNCKESEVVIIECDPSDNANCRPESKFEIGCIKNPDYFRIKHIKIKIESLDVSLRPSTYCTE